MRDGSVRRARLRLLRVSTGADAERGPYVPPLLSVSPRHVRQVLASGERRVLALEGAREELWYRSEGAALRAAIDDAGKLELAIEAGETRVDKRLVRIPGKKAPPASGPSRYFARWEHAKDRAVLSARGAGIILEGKDGVTAEVEPVLVDVYRGEGVLVALREVPRGAVVVAAEGLEGITEGTVVSDIALPDVERGPEVEVHPSDAFLRGAPPIGFSARFAGLDFAGFARAQGDGSPDLARFTRRSGGLAWGAVRIVDAPSDPDALLASALDAELAASPGGRRRIGKAATIALSDDRRYRVKAACRERLDAARLATGGHELVACVLASGGAIGSILIRLGVPIEGFEEPDAERVLATLRDFLIGLYVRT